MRLVVWQIAVDNGRLGVIKMAFDVVNPGNLVQLGDIERAIMDGDAVRPVQPCQYRFDLGPAIAAGHRIDPVEQPSTDKHRSPIADPQRARLGHAARKDLDMEVLRQL